MPVPAGEVHLFNLQVHSAGRARVYGHSWGRTGCAASAVGADLLLDGGAPAQARQLARQPALHLLPVGKLAGVRGASEEALLEGLLRLLHTLLGADLCLGVQLLLPAGLEAVVQVGVCGDGVASLSMPGTLPGSSVLAAQPCRQLLPARQPAAEVAKGRGSGMLPQLHVRCSGVCCAATHAVHEADCMLQQLVQAHVVGGVRHVAMQGAA